MLHITKLQFIIFVYLKFTTYDNISLTYYIILYYIRLYCIISNHIILYYIVLHYKPLYLSNNVNIVNVI